MSTNLKFDYVIVGCGLGSVIQNHLKQAERLCSVFG